LDKVLFCSLYFPFIRENASSGIKTNKKQTKTKQKQKKHKNKPTYKTDRHDIDEILLKVALNTIKQTNKPFSSYRWRQMRLSKHYTSPENTIGEQFPQE
jgi:hypothetical protein